MEKTFSAAFNEHLTVSGMKIPAIAELSGVKADTLYKIRSGKSQNMRVADAVKVAQAFGKTVEEFMGMSDQKVRGEIETLMDLLTEDERALLLAPIKALLGPRMTEQPQPVEDAKEEPHDPHKSGKSAG